MSNILWFVNSLKFSITNSWHLLKGTKISSLMPKGPLMGSCAIVQRGLLFPKYPVTQFSNLSGMSLLFAGPSYFLHQCNIQICTRPSHCDARDNIFDTKACNLKNILRTDQGLFQPCVLPSYGRVITDWDAFYASHLIVFKNLQMQWKW